MSRWTFTSESVTEGHPDKMADQISDTVLDAILAEDPDGRVACETLLTTGLCVIAGEITTSAYVDIPKLARETIKSIGYDDALYGFDGGTCGVIVSIDEQSPDIGQGVDKSEELRAGEAGEDPLDAQGAGDQGMMFGFACDETPDLMPLPIWTAHRLAERLAEVRKSGQVPYLRPDGKTQVTFEYEDGVPVALKAVLISTQHQDGVDRDTVIRPDLIEQVIQPTIPEQFADDPYEVFINPTGTFVLGGPHADCGLTGRKIIVDTYGGMGRHGGGAFSGKDPSKVDRSAAYAARWVAKHVVASGRRDAVRGAGGLRHRRRPPGERARRDVRHEHRRSGADLQERAGGVRPASRGDHPRPRAEAADLPRHGGLRPLRPQPPAVHVGARQPPRRLQGRRRPVDPARLRVFAADPSRFVRKSVSHADTNARIGRRVVGCFPTSPGSTSSSTTSFLTSCATAVDRRRDRARAAARSARARLGHGGRPGRRRSIRPTPPADRPVSRRSARLPS